METAAAEPALSFCSGGASLDTLFGSPANASEMPLRLDMSWRLKAASVGAMKRQRERCTTNGG